jgi:hypothetical protein
LHAGGQGFESLILHCLRKVSGSGGSRMYLENRTTCKRKQCITKKRDRDNRYQQEESLMMSGNLRFQPRSQESESKEFQDLKRDPAKRLTERPSEEGHKVDALVLGAEERRDKLRKAAWRSTYPVIRRYLNGGTRCE